jgi:hypothetical protein
LSRTHFLLDQDAARDVRAVSAKQLTSTVNQLDTLHEQNPVE